MLRVRYVVLYVTDAEVCRRFWVEQVGMVEKDRKEFGGFSIVQVGFADQPFAFELVPLALMADNPDAVPMNLNQLESDYQVIQDEPVSGGNGNRRRKRNAGNIDPTTRAVVRRIETLAYTGAYDPVTNEAICLDGLCNAPDASEIGEILSVQMTAANVQPDSVVVSVVGGGRVTSSDKVIDCGGKCAGSYSAGTVVTLTAKADSKGTFTGWSGACAGTGTCTVAANGIQTVNATFAARASGGGGGGTTGGGGATTNRTLSVKTSGKGLVTSNVGGINCGKTCSASVAISGFSTFTM